MDIRLHRLCLVAQSLRDMHGVYYAACFLFGNGVDIELALAALVHKRPS
ncbi:hypothetical protein [Pseudoduganella sp. UC29_71]